MSRKEFSGSGTETQNTVYLRTGDGQLVVPEASLLFQADFLRAGPDLILRNEGHADLRILDYFRDPSPADIFAPDGAVLRGDTVARLAGPEAPGQYAQIGPRGGEPIGQVETVDGGARVQRTDGTLEDLLVGMKIFQGDAVETGADGALSLTFADGTIFTLAASSRMVIDELVYDPNGTENSGAFSLVQGGFVFIAGQVAKTGGMEVTTPSATMGIRGTTVIVRVELDNGIVVTEVTLTRDPDGGLGVVELRGLDGNLISDVTGTDTKWLVSTAEGQTRAIDRTVQDDASDNFLIAEAVAAFQRAVTRVAQGDTFVTLPSIQQAPDLNGEGGEGEDGETDLDGVDDPLPPAPQTGGEGGSDGGGGSTGPTTDATRTRVDLRVGDVIVVGPEDAGSGDEGAPIDGDIEAEGEDVTYTLESGPAKGTVELNPDGTFSYIPDPDFNGTDRFIYRATDREGKSGTGTVEVRVTPVNDEPVTSDVAVGGAEDSVILGVVPATDVDGDALGYLLFRGPSNGLVVLLGDGTFAYTPDADFFGPDSFEVEVRDGAGGSAIATVTVDVAGANDAPVITSAPVDAAPSEDDVLGGDGPALTGAFTASDVDPGDAVSFVYGPVTVELRDPDGNPVPDYPASDFGLRDPAGALGLLSLNADGTWSLARTDGFDALPEGFSLIYRGSAQARDDSGSETDTSAPQTFTLTVAGQNDAPEITFAVTTGAVTEPAGGDDGVLPPLEATGRIEVADLDHGSTHTATAIPLGSGYVGDFSLDASGFTEARAGGGSAGGLNWNFAVDPADIAGLLAGEVLTQRYLIEIVDDVGAAVSQTITITITGANDGATIAGNLAGAVAEDGEAVATGSLAVTDPDTGEAGLRPLTDVAGAFGRFSVDAAGSWRYVLDNASPSVQALGDDDAPTDAFVVTSVDGTASETVVITVRGVNDAPVIVSDAADHEGRLTEGAEEATATGRVIAEDADGDALTYILTSPSEGAYGSLTLEPSGAWRYTLDQEQADALREGEEATDIFSVRVTDTAGAEAVQEIAVTITGTNDVPIVAFRSVIEVTQDTVFDGTLTAVDPEGDDVTFSLGGVEPSHGVLSLNPDGSYTYTPDPGFFGLDSFAYIARDSAGLESVGRINIEVENTGGTDEEAPVSLGIKTVATPEVAAGSLVIEAEPVEGNALNLVFALDRSGSIRLAPWRAMTDSVATALEDLATRFADSETQVDVHIITYATDVTTFTFDLSDPTIGAQVRALPYFGGQTNWTGAFNAAEEFLAAQPAGEANSFFFVTDGNPTVGASQWLAALASLTDAETNGFTVDIDAFAIGSAVDGENLEIIDSDPVPPGGTNYTRLTSASDFLDTLTATPLFNPELVGLSVRLIADGVDRGVIADETSPALVVSGLNYALPFAAIEGIEDLLGVENQFSVTALYDLDGDLSDAELTLFATELLAPAATAQTLTGLGGADLLFGSDLADTIDGAGGGDVIFGFGGDDAITGGAGADVLDGGAGNDTLDGRAGIDLMRGGTGDDVLRLSDAPEVGDQAHGGAGRDVLDLDLSGDLTAALDTLLFSGIEVLDFENGAANTLSLTGEAVIGASDTADPLLEALLGTSLPDSMMILGDPGDGLALVDSGGGEWQDAGVSVSSGGRTFDVYQFLDTGSFDVLATIGVDQDIAVTTGSAATA